MLSKIHLQFKKMFQSGVVWIFGSAVLSQITGFLSSVLVIRNLPKTDYGEYVVANNIYSYLIIFSGLGLANAILQFCSENVSKQKKASIYSYAFGRGNLFNVFLALLIVIGSICLQQFIGIQASHYLFLMFGLPMVSYLNSYCQIILRVKRDNIQYAIINMVYAVFMVTGNLLFTNMLGVIGLVYGTYTANIFAALVGFFLLQRDSFFSYVHAEKVSLLGEEKREILQYSVLCALTNLTSTALVLIDVTCLNLFSVNSEALADYKIASMIPTSLLFIQTCLIIYFYPYLAENFSIGLGEFYILFSKLIKLFAILGTIVSTALFIFAPWIIKFFYGEAYLSCVPVFRILCVNYFLMASFRKLFGNVIAATKQVKINLYHTIVAGVLNIFLNVILIQRYNSAGAAIATVITTAFVTLLEALYFRLRLFSKKNN